MHEIGKEARDMNINVSGNLDHLLERDGLDFVQACYREILQREADAPGLAHHLNALNAGIT